MLLKYIRYWESYELLNQLDITHNPTRGDAAGKLFDRLKADVGAAYYQDTEGENISPQAYLEGRKKNKTS